MKPTTIAPAEPLLAVESIDATYSGEDADWTTAAGSVPDQWKQPVRAATTGAVTIATALNAGDAIDGVTLAAGDRVLVKDQAGGDAEQNGIYVAGTTPVRAADMDDSAEVMGAIVTVIAGTANAGTTWRTTNTSAPVIDTNDILWEAFGSGASLSDDTPVQDGGAGTAGVGTEASRDDHKHPGDTVAIVAVFDGSGSEIADNTQLDLRIPFACTLTSWTLLADVAGAIVVDVWRDVYGSFPPTDADALPGSGKEPTIAATNARAEDTTITDWVSDDLVAGDCLRFNVDSCTTITRATLTLYAVRT